MNKYKKQNIKNNKSTNTDNFKQDKNKTNPVLVVFQKNTKIRMVDLQKIPYQDWLV